MEIQSIPTALAPTPTQQTPGTQLGKDQFFQLLVTQLQHQDPLQPQDNSEFVAQLAQFSSLEQLQGLGGQLSTLNLLTTSLNNAQAVDLVGRDVVFQSSTLGVQDPEHVPALGVQLPSGSTSGTVKILDAQGSLVRTLAVPAGESRQSVLWDGKDEHGNTVAAGQYQVDVSGVQPDGSTSAGQAFVQGRVDRVRFSGGQVLLEVAGQDVTLDAVSEITSAATTSPTTSSSASALRAFSAALR
jgi:flagellar basal-body rod modification protein FlgD